MRLLFILIFCLLLNNTAVAGINEILDATCKIKIGKFSGTATVFKEDAEYYWLISAGHVGYPGTKGTACFYLKGEPSQEIPLEFVWRTWKKGTSDDLAFYKFKKPKDLKIKVIPLAPKYYKVTNNEVILTCGCAHGLWPTLWRGKVTDLTTQRVEFQPPVPIGRSGSGIFNEGGAVILAVIITSDSNHGQAVPIEKIYNFLENIK